MVNQTQKRSKYSGSSKTEQVTDNLGLISVSSTGNLTMESRSVSKANPMYQ